MPASFKQHIFTNWGFRRFLGLGLALFFAIQSIQLGDALIGVISVLLLFQVVTNTGCFGSAGCSINYDEQAETDNTGNEIKDVKFTEVKQEQL